MKGPTAAQLLSSYASRYLQTSYKDTTRISDSRTAEFRLNLLRKEAGETDDVEIPDVRGQAVRDTPVLGLASVEAEMGC